MSTRECIVQAADALFYERGFERTSFADIAEAVQISRGNFYYHFRTKDEILDAVIAARTMRTQCMLAQWEAECEGPQNRIRLFAELLIRNQAKIMKHGCPVGGLCMELSKLGHAAQDGANAILDLFRAWLRQQFEQMGRKKDADALALHLLMRSQGVATLAQALHDKQFVQHEVDQIMSWVQSCAPSTKRRVA
ncbi:helix-turn-helix domain containing protein [Paucibacter sediminis]|uniref:Helix-turn-helix domain containing protein n=1 Tax=Paucibacter sediminis TaxID=3019553 RepID=A0AA95NQ39_9BURK|nr:TetR/AcrR family transcriptional regulator [Paucibacter sp. S2-9]WIT14111.1 helix-turn-helix domain containing protein [Paucibacter sp. S2-9]